MDTFRRLLLLSPLTLCANHSRAEARGFVFGTTPVILDEQAQFLAAWQIYLEKRLGAPVRFVQRGNYREILALLVDGQIDFAWLCGYPYVRQRKRLSLVASPVYHGAPLYQSYLIVGNEDRATRSIADLQGKVFAFSDPDSNSGWLTPQVELKKQGLEAGRFFGKTFFTWSHRKVIEAVAVGLAQGGAVDGYIWDTLARFHPEITARTRVAWRSERFGFPPIVAGYSASAQMKSLMQEVLKSMQSDAAGRSLLARLNLDGFDAVADTTYASIERNWRYLAS
jgi:phosphonate transport system substrate-binding protein